MSTISAPGAVFCLPTDSGTKSFPHCLPTDPTAAANKKRKVDKDSSSAATGFGGSSPASKYPPNPDSTRCSYYHPSKSRYCKGRPLPSTLLCGNHTPNGGIPCPACGTTVKEGKWKRHENRCNALKLRRQREAEPWYSEGLNLPKGEGEEPGAPRAAEELLGLAKAVMHIHSTLSLPLSDLSGPELSAGFLPKMRSLMVPLGTEKHVVQLSSLLANLSSRGMLHGAGKVLELGAGRGMLGLVVAGRSKSCKELELVDRASSRRLAETRIRNPDTRRERGSEADGGEGYDFDLKKVDVKRVKCDIKDVDVSKLSCGSGLVVAKHLCGMGTDIALRSLRRTKSGGFVMATCCHGVCDWDALVGRDWLVKRFEERGVKLGKGEFEVLKRWCGATTSDDYVPDKKGGTRKGNEGEGKGGGGGEGEGEVEGGVGVEQEEQHQVSGRLDIPGAGMVAPMLEPPVSKQALGRAAQRCIDAARVHYAKEELGFKGATMCYYVGEGVTPQNCALFSTGAAAST